MVSLATHISVLHRTFWTLSGSPSLLAHPTLLELAQKLSLTPAQTVYRLAQGLGLTPLAGSTSESHMRDGVLTEKVNIQSEEYVELLAELNTLLAG